MRLTPVEAERLSVAGWVLVVGAAAMGVVSLSLIDQIVLLGIAVVLPWSAGGPYLWWGIAAVSAFVSLLLPAGWAGPLVLPFVFAAAAALVVRFRKAGPLLFWSLDDTAEVIASAYGLVAAAALMQSRFGLHLLGIREPIVELTAVHYSFAGCAALVLAVAAHRSAKGQWARVGGLAVVCTAAAPAVVAVGFVSRSALPQVGGAVLMTLGVWATASVQIRTVFTRRISGATTLLAVSGVAVWIPMVLAVAWAGGQHWNIPALSIPDMARTHGLVNALAFVLCGLLGWRHLGAATVPSELVA